MKKLEEYFDELNITEYHNKGFKGQRVKIMTMEKEGSHHKKQVQGIIKKIAPEAEIHNFYWYGSKFVDGVKVYKLTEAIDYAIEHGIHIIQISQHGNNKDYVKREFQRAIDAGIIITCAAGNNGKNLDDISVFASTNLTIDVGSTTDNHEKEYYSNDGSQLELVSYDTFIIDNDLIAVSGTSFADPIVAGQLALGISSGISLNQHKTFELIKNNVKDIGKKGKDDDFGYGIFITPKIKPESIKEEDMDITYLIPFKNTKGLRITSKFGMRIHPVDGINKMHKGLDMVANDFDLIAASDGEAVYTDKLGSYGNLLRIETKDGLELRYAHLKEFKVKKGDKVKAGDVVAVMGNTGIGTGAHLHFEIRKNGEALNPAPILGIKNEKGVVRVAEKKPEINKYEPSDWAKETWKLATELALTDGTRPTETFTREQGMTVIVRALMKSGAIVPKGGTYVWKD